MNTDNSLLTRAECNAMRGLAIMGIFLHNYCHWLGPVVKENEYEYNQGNVDWLWRVTTNADALLPMHWISFFGHYGVPVFLFLSAYGLEKKYGNAQQKPGVWQFTRYHFLKLFSMMIVGFAAFTMVDAITPGRWHYDVTQIVAQLLMVNNLLPDPDHQIWPGPYWFFGLMLQLYIVYRLLLYRRHWAVTALLMAVCVGIQLCLPPMGEAINSYRYNFPGGMLPFGAGILAARIIDRPLAIATPTLAALTVLLSLLAIVTSCSVIGWTLTPIVIIAACAALAKLLARAKSIMWAAVWMGEISAALFVCHPITRKIFIPISRSGDHYAGLLLYIIASLCLAWLFKEIMSRLPKPKMK